MSVYIVIITRSPRQDVALCISFCLSVCLSVCWSRSWALQIRLNRSRCRLGGWLMWAQWTMS